MSTAQSMNEGTHQESRQDPPPPLPGGNDLPGAPPKIDFTEDAEPMPPETIAKLARKVDPALVEVKPPAGLLFVPWIHYQHVLLDAFGPGGFKLVPTSPSRQIGPKEMTWTGALFVRPPGSRKFQFIKEATGECPIQGGMTVANAKEGAQSDCLVKCCKQLGIFHELFDPAWRRWWEREYKQTHARDVANPQRPERTEATTLPKDEAAATRGISMGHMVQTPGPGTTTPAMTDTGEAIDANAVEAITDAIRRLKLKRGYVKLWLIDFFGEKVQAVEALTKAQGDAALVLLQAHGTSTYGQLVQKLQNEGRIGGGR